MIFSSCAGPVFMGFYFLESMSRRMEEPMRSSQDRRDGSPHRLPHLFAAPDGGFHF
jgi:hypothetical protein